MRVLDISPRIVVAVGTDEPHPRTRVSRECDNYAIWSSKVLDAQSIERNRAGDPVSECSATTLPEIVQKPLIGAGCRAT